MPSLKSSKFANLTPERLAELSDRPDCVVYEPTHDTVFEPWPAERVRSCVRRIVDVARRCTDEEEARRLVRTLPDVPEFEAHYQVMFQRLTEPAVARNRGHVEIILGMVGIRERVERGTLTDEGAQRLVSEQALAGLLSQAQRNQSSS